MKLARGELFSDRHWIEFLELAELPLKSLDQILLRHILRCRPTLFRKLTDLKVNFVFMLKGRIVRLF